MDNLVYNLQQHIDIEIDTLDNELLELLYQLTH